MWLAFRNGLSTEEKLASWGYGGEVQCVFCRSCIESIEHLFFERGYSKRLWQALTKKNSSLDFPSTWSDIVRLGIREWRKKSLMVVMCKLW